MGWRGTGLAWLTALASLAASPRPVHAQGRDLSVQQKPDWYALHGGLTAATLTLGVGVVQAAPTSARWTSAPALERFAEGRDSSVSRAWSDAALLSSVLLPPVFFASRADGLYFANASIVYAETLSVGLALNSLVKVATARARPDRVEGLRGGEAVLQPGDAQSFYSGHAAMSFAAATSGSYLYAAGGENYGARAAFWGASSCLAAFTAHARVRAGRHYPTDVLVGGLMGAALGTAIPVLHEVEVELQPEEWGLALGGLVSGVLLGFLLPTSELAEQVAAASPTLVPLQGGGLLSFSGDLR